MDNAAAVICLVCFAALNAKFLVVESVIPYLIIVVYIACRHGTAWGLVIAGLATLSAVSGGTYSQPGTEAAVWGLAMNYCKLSGAVVGIGIGRFIALRPAQH